jgi:hypothetical protein
MNLSGRGVQYVFYCGAGFYGRAKRSLESRHSGARIFCMHSGNCCCSWCSVRIIPCHYRDRAIERMGMGTFNGGPAANMCGRCRVWPHWDASLEWSKHH